jgi:hypothetical protein
MHVIAACCRVDEDARVRSTNGGPAMDEGTTHMDQHWEQNPISRRTVIKRAGVIGAVAWSAPVLSSLGTPAFAGTNENCEWQCPDATPPFACGDDCLRTLTNELECFCWQNFECTGERECFGSAFCPPGYRCVRTCCPEGMQCAPPCGTRQVIPAGAQTATGG